MPKPKIHLRQGGCAIRSSLGDNTTEDQKSVTCGLCLAKMQGRRLGGSPTNPNGSNPISVNISDKALTKYHQIPKFRRSETISRFLEGI